MPELECSSTKSHRATARSHSVATDLQNDKSKIWLFCLARFDVLLQVARIQSTDVNRYMLLCDLWINKSIISFVHTLFHSRLKKTFFFSANPSHRSLPFSLRDWLHGFPGLFTDTSEHIRFFYSLVFLFSTFSCWVPCGRSARLKSAFERTLNSHLASYRSEDERNHYRLSGKR